MDYVSFADIDIYSTRIEEGGVFIMLVGPPCSGKSQVVDQLNEYGDFAVIRPDDIRQDLVDTTSEDPSSNEVFKIVYTKMVDYLSEKKNVVYDATNCRTNYREKIMRIIHDYVNFAICLVSTKGLLDCLKENERNGSEVPSDVIERMYFTLHKYPPNIYEGYDAIFSF